MYATVEELRNDYYVDRLSMKQIAEKYGYASPHQASKAVRRCGDGPRSKIGLLHNFHRPGKRIGEHLSDTALQVVYGCLLGDGTLRDNKKYGGNSVLATTHKIEHKEYVDWLSQQLGAFYSCITHREPSYSQIVTKCQPSLMLTSINHPDFSELRRRFYPNGKKIMPDGILDKLSELSVSVWIMDDGCYNKPNRRIQLATQSFTREENERIANWFASWGIIATTARVPGGSGFATNFSAKSTERIRELFGYYFVPCMRYKLGYANG